MYFFIVMITSAFINTAFNHEGITVLYYLPDGNPLTFESVVYGFASSVMLINVIVWFSCYSSVMTSDKFIYLFGKIIPSLSLIFSMTLSFIPKDGIILSERKAVFYEGESVFNILFRELKKNKIHLEFMSTPVYNSVYIEGINNIYEFDCCELSGWMYKVNGWFPNYGCSRYQLKEGDTVELIYTCDLGRDIGGGYAAGKQKDE